MRQVLDEIGINLNASLVSAPGQKVAQAAPAAAAAQPMAQPLGAGEGARRAAAGMGGLAGLGRAPRGGGASVLQPRGAASPSRLASHRCLQRAAAAAAMLRA